MKAKTNLIDSYFQTCQRKMMFVVPIDYPAIQQQMNPVDFVVAVLDLTIAFHALAMAVEYIRDEPMKIHPFDPLFYMLDNLL